MLQEVTVSGDKGEVCFANNKMVESGEVGGQLPEKLLEPEIANENTENGKRQQTAFTEGDGSSASSPLQRRGGMLVFC